MAKALILHGGAWDIPDQQVEANKRGIGLALDTGWKVLERGGSALDALIEAILVMEEDPTFNAGYGSVLSRAGTVEMDASVMDGRTLDIGAVACVTRVRNPILLARHVLFSENVLMVGSGAEDFGEAQGIPLIDPRILITQEQRALWESYRVNPPVPEIPLVAAGDTVGGVVIDGDGSIAAGNSTGGRDFKMPGRVGDSPLVGCGFYADNSLGGAACTGWGESIARILMARRTMEALEDGADPATAARHAVAGLGRVGGTAGVIVADPSGRVGFAYNSRRMARAWRTEGDEFSHIEV